MFNPYLTESSLVGTLGHFHQREKPPHITQWDCWEGFGAESSQSCWLWVCSSWANILTSPWDKRCLWMLSQSLCQEGIISISMTPRNKAVHIQTKHLTNSKQLTPEFSAPSQWGQSLLADDFLYPPEFVFWCNTMYNVVFWCNTIIWMVV